MSTSKKTAPKNMSEMRQLMGDVMAGVLNKEIPTDDARVVLTAAARINESIQAEIRARSLALAAGFTIKNEMPITSSFVE
jgi:hypothetical protein